MGYELIKSYDIALAKIARFVAFCGWPLTILTTVSLSFIDGFVWWLSLYYGACVMLLVCLLHVAIRIIKFPLHRVLVALTAEKTGMSVEAVDAEIKRLAKLQGYI